MSLVSHHNAKDVLHRLLELPQGSPIAVDCETTGLFPYQGDRLRGFSFAFHEGDEIPGFYVPVGYPEGNLDLGHLHTICGAIKSLDPIYVYHHAKFDLRFLRQLPMQPNGGRYFPVPEPYKLWDTKLVAWLMDENYSTSLDAQVKLHHLGEKMNYWMALVIEIGTKSLKDEGVKRPKKDDIVRRGLALITAEQTAEYGAEDAILTLMLRDTQLEILRTESPLYGDPSPAIEREHDVQRLLLRVEDNGVMVDEGMVEDLRQSVEKERAEIERWFIENFATDVTKNAQVARLLFDTLGLEPPIKTPSGKPSVNRQTLELLDAPEHHSVIERLLRHRRLQKSMVGYLVPLAEYVAPDQRLHPTFWQHGTVTGRFSCANPNLQTIPRADTLEGVRNVFVAAEGYELWEYDLQAAELRVLAGMAQEQRLIDQLEQGTDMHSANAAEIFGPNFTPLQRRAAKNIMYGWSYGLTKRETASKYITSPTVSFKQAMEIADTVLLGIKKLYPRIFKLMNATTRRAEKAGYIRIHDEAWPGRFRHFITEADKAPRMYTALNAQVQGGIGEFMKDVMLAAEYKLEQLGARLCLQVHDSLVIEVPEGQGEAVQQVLQWVADTLNPFAMRMIFDAKPWEAHD